MLNVLSDIYILLFLAGKLALQAMKVNMKITKENSSMVEHYRTLTSRLSLYALHNLNQNY